MRLLQGSPHRGGNQGRLRPAAAVATIAGLAGTVALAILVARAPSRASAGAAGAPDQLVTQILARLDPARSVVDLRRLSGAQEICADGECGQIVNRLTGDPGLALAMDYIVDSLDGLGYGISVEPWRSGRLSDRNVLLRKTGVISPTEEVYVVAHVDGVGTCPGPQCPAADDNGSGTVAALELARAFAETAFARTVVILFSTGEEQGTVGVNRYIATLTPAELARIEALVNADMLGYDRNRDNVMELYYGDDPRSLALAQAMGRTIETYVPELAPRIDPGCG